jgi:hypothetical protein
MFSNFSASTSLALAFGNHPHNAASEQVGLTEIGVYRPLHEGTSSSVLINSLEE